MISETVWLSIVACMVIASIVLGVKRMRKPLWPSNQSTSLSGPLTEYDSKEANGRPNTNSAELAATHL